MCKFLFNGLKLKLQTSIVLIIILSAGISALRLNSALEFNGDNVHYIILAEALVNGNGYTDIYHPKQGPHNVYPIGFPILLTPAIAFFDRNILLIKLIPWAFSLLTLWALYILLKNSVENEFVRPILLITAIHPLNVYFSTSVLSESTYFLFTILSFVFVNQYKQSDFTDTNKFILALVFLVFSFYVRLIGITAFIAFALFMVFHKQLKKTIIISICYVLCISPWVFRSFQINSFYWIDRFFAGGGESNLSKLTIFYDTIQKVLLNICYYIGKVIPNAIFFPFFRTVDKWEFWFMIKLFIGIFITCVFCMGLFSSVYKKLKIFDVYIIGYLLVCIVYPWHTYRFLYPVFPFIIYYIVLGIRFAIQRIPFWRLRITSYPFVSNMICLIIFASILPGNFYLIENSLKGKYYSDYEKNYFSTIRWVSSNTMPNDIIVCRKPRIVYFYSNRKALYIPSLHKNMDSNKLTVYLDENKANYIISRVFEKKDTKEVEVQLNQIMAKEEKRFHIIHKTGKPEVHIYRYTN